MFFILLTLFSALLLEGIGTVVSVIGLVQLFGFTELIVSLAIAFDIAKVTAVTVLYREWNKLSRLLRLYFTAASIVLMTITSMGAASYLSTNFQKNSLPVKTLEVKVKSMTEEKVKLEARKKEIDTQIANLPADYVKGRTKLLNNFKSEIERINDRIVVLDTEVPKVQTEMIEATSHAGPIMYLAIALKTTPEGAMGWLIGLMIFVFDPLAVALILAGNFLIAERQKAFTNKELPKEEVLIQPVSPKPPTELGVSDNDWFDVDYYSPKISDSETLPPDLHEFFSDKYYDEIINDPIEEREENVEDERVQQEVDPDANFYPYFSKEMVEQAKSVASIPEQQTSIEEEPVEHASLSDVNDSREKVSFDGSIPSAQLSNYSI